LLEEPLVLLLAAEVLLDELLELTRDLAFGDREPAFLCLTAHPAPQQQIRDRRLAQGRILRVGLRRNLPDPLGGGDLRQRLVVLLLADLAVGSVLDQGHVARWHARVADALGDRHPNEHHDQERGQDHGRDDPPVLGR
jgi:hypothetical protein